MNPKQTNQQLAGEDIDRALSAPSDGIVPSSGFADSVMTAICREASAPAPIPFPWKRAIPGFVAALVALGLLLATLPAALRSSGREPGSLDRAINWPTVAAPLAHHGNDIVWILTSLAIAAVCLLLCRRLVFPR